MWKSIFGNIVIAAFFSIFVYINLKAFTTTGDASYVLVAFNESLYVLLYLVRRRPVATSTSLLDWGAGFSGTFIGTLLRPASPISALIGGVIIFVGTAINILAVLSLGRSIATVPAERSLKTSGMYRYIRHPMYASELFVLFGYLLVNASILNLLVATATTTLLFVRINREERFLSRNSAYISYQSRTPWKLIPFMY